jgi:hypothetical protein
MSFSFIKSRISIFDAKTICKIELVRSRLSTRGNARKEHELRNACSRQRASTHTTASTHEQTGCAPLIQLTCKASNSFFFRMYSSKASKCVSRASAACCCRSWRYCTDSDSGSSTCNDDTSQTLVRKPLLRQTGCHSQLLSTAGSKVPSSEALAFNRRRSKSAGDNTR